MGKNFDSNYIRELADEISKCSSISYDDFPNYDLFLSQVVEYLNDKFANEEFTNNIVQNYIKSEVITKPEDGKKRGYTKTHLIQSGRSETFRFLSPLRTVLVTFTTYGSSHHLS